MLHLCYQGQNLHLYACASEPGQGVWNGTGLWSRDWDSEGDDWVVAWSAQALHFGCIPKALYDLFYVTYLTSVSNEKTITLHSCSHPPKFYLLNCSSVCGELNAVTVVGRKLSQSMSFASFVELSTAYFAVTRLRNTSVQFMPQLAYPILTTAYCMLLPDYEHAV